MAWVYELSPDGLNLIDLNDDCLVQIFTHLPPMCLANFAYANVRLNNLIKRYIQAKFKIRFVRNFNLVAHNETIPINFCVLEAVLYIFGQDVNTLTLHKNIFDDTYDEYDNNMDKIQIFINDYCPKLKEMTLIGFKMRGLTQPFFARLESLTLVGCSVTRNWIRMCKLKTLKLNMVTFRPSPLKYKLNETGEWIREKVPIPFPSNRFSALTELQLADVNFDNHTIEKFLKRNKGIRKLSIGYCHEITPAVNVAVGKLINLTEYNFVSNASTHQIDANTPTDSDSDSNSNNDSFSTDNDSANLFDVHNSDL